MKHRFESVLSLCIVMAGTSAAYADADAVAPGYSRGPVAEVSSSARPMQNPLPAPSSALVKAVSTSGLATGSSTGGQSYEQRAFGSFGIPYTSTRVITGPSSYTSATPNYLSTTYPYRAVGRLDFNTSSGAAFCSASVIRKGVVVTAAHCVQNFGSSTFFTNWVFRPGYYGASGATSTQIAPYGAWTLGTWLARSVKWSTGTDKGCGAARENDLALFIVPKQNGKFIGEVTGYFNYGWGNLSFVSSSKTGNLSVGAVSTLGYPGLLDGGRIMQRTDGPTFTTTVCSSPNTVPQLWQGSDFTGGSSGGPWLVNFRSGVPALTGGAVVGSANNGNAIIGVTSWGSANPNTPKDNYSSQFRQNSAYPNADYGGFGAGNIGSLMNSLCSGKPAGSTLTYKQLGYCS